MNITNKRKETEYRYVDIGTVFKSKNEYYMVTEELKYYRKITNCVNLDSGKHCYFNDNDMIEVVEVEIIVK